MILRDALPSDLPALYRINEAGVPGVGQVTQAGLGRLLGQALITLVAEQKGEPAGFILCLAEGSDYASPNYRWFAGRYTAFAYVDRIAIAPEAQGQGLGAALYRGLEERLTGLRPLLGCEVNELPPNPGSLRFHKRLGFTEAGRQVFEPGKKAVVYLEKKLQAVPV